MERRDWKQRARFAVLLAAAFAVAVTGSWLLGGPLNNAAYDFFFRLYRPAPWEKQSVVLAIDEDTLRATPDGMHGIRKTLSRALRLVAEARPKAVAVDVILADQRDAATDRDLAEALCSTPRVVLASESIDRNNNRWEDPRPEFARCAAAIGHVHAQPEQGDSRTRAIPLLKRVGRDRRWAIALEAF